MTPGRNRLEEIVAGLSDVTPGPWRREALGGASTVLAKSKPPRNDTRAASYGYRDEEYCLAHPFLDDDNQPRMDFVCFGHADAAHIARCSPDAIREIAAYVSETEARATAAEATVTALQEKLGTANALVTCCCGSPVETHGMGDGHSPVDMYHYDRMQREARIADLEERLAKAAEALEQAETDRAEQWRLRRDAEGSRDAAAAAADSLRIERDMLRTVLSDISEGWDFWQVNPHDREPPRDAIRRARTALSQIRSEK